MSFPINITSEIGRLRTVILKRPSKEIENITPEYMKNLLFDDIPYLPIIQDEHDYFSNVLKDYGTEVLYLDDLVAESLTNDEVKNSFIDSILIESNFKYNYVFSTIKDYLLSLSTKNLVLKVMEGIRKDELKFNRRSNLQSLAEKHYPFYLDPMPNLYFTRDPAACIANGISINRMKEPVRRRESMFIKYIIEHHPLFTSHHIPIWFNRDNQFSLEGGDQLVLSKEVVAIGISERSTPTAIESIAHNLFKNQASINKVIAIEIPKTRAFMHLDTVFTMVDYNKFIIHPEIKNANDEISTFILEKGSDLDTIKISQRNKLDHVLKEVLGLDEVVLIPCGGGDKISAPREQWSDGSNTLAIEPGVLICYDRNYVSNELLREHGVKVIEIKSSELSRGRGGPRCMSMPIFRDNI